MELHGESIELPIKYSAVVLRIVDDYINGLWPVAISRKDTSVENELCFFYYKDRGIFEAWHKKGWTKDRGPDMLMVFFDLADNSTTIVGEDPVLMKGLEVKLNTLTKN